ncbi:hypothetical protein J2X16_002783 [Pelomonas aquatica]|uniref:Uncharacterized protein n=1 Tax=Pelomonas aquatica TaxID=431058 RepID=A0ABU1Z9Y5_9BURK|nr:hypothetical protein [Pelomonas aquatica]MDR7297434.1 hypothetical protein [Pelomonas aquatica]
MNPIDRLLLLVGRVAHGHGLFLPSTQGLPTLRDVMAMPYGRGQPAMEHPGPSSAAGRQRWDPNARASKPGLWRNAAKRVAAWARIRPRVEEAPAKAAPRAPARRGRSQRRVKALLTAPFRWVAHVVCLDVKLKREGRTLHILLAARPPAIKKPSGLDKAIAEAAPLRRALKQFLDLHPMTRKMLRHLGYLERALGTQGVKAFAEVPVEVLEVSLEQLESIVTNWSDRDLAELRSKLAVAVKDRLQDQFGTDGQRSDFATASRLMVGDIPHSEFVELERQYQGLVSQETIQAALDAIRTPALDEPAAVPGDCTAGEPFPIREAEWASHEAKQAKPAALRRAP